MVRAPELLHPLIREIVRLYKLGKQQEVTGALEQALASLSTGVISTVRSHDADILSRLERLEQAVFSPLHTSANTDYSLMPTHNYNTVNTQMHTVDSSNGLVPTPVSSKLSVAVNLEPEAVVSVVVESQDDEGEWLSRADGFAIAKQRGYKAKIQAFAHGNDESRYARIGFIIDSSRKQIGKHHYSRWLKDIRTMRISKDTRLNQVCLGARLGLFKTDGNVDEIAISVMLNRTNFETWSQGVDFHHIAWRFDLDTQLSAPILGGVFNLLMG